MKLPLAVTAFLALGSVGANAAVFNFDNFAAGTILTSVSNGGVSADIDVESNGSNDIAMVFDTANPTGNDSDLAAPFFETGAGTGTLNPLKVLIISTDGDQGDPDDEAKGGKITFTFENTVTFLGFDILDDADITVTSDRGDSAIISVANDNEFASASFNWAGVSTLTFDFGNASGAIDNLQFAPVPVPAGLMLLLTGCGALGFARRRRQASA